MRTERTRTITTTALSALAVCAALAGTAAAETVVVDAGQSIQGAINRAAPGDVIVVRGTHVAPEIDIRGKSDLTIRGVGRGSTIDGSTGVAPTLSIVNSTAIRVEGLKVVAGHRGAIAIEDSTDVRVHRNRIRIDDLVIPAAAVPVSGSTAVEISRNNFKGATPIAIRLGSDAAPVDLSVVARNRFKRVGGVAVAVTGQQNVVLRNRMQKGRSSIVVNGTLGGEVNVIRRNRMNNPRGHAVKVNSGASVVAENTARLAVLDSIVVEGESHAITANKVKRACRDGICVVGSKSALVSNRVVASTDAGIVVLGDENLIRNNAVKRSGDAGVEVAGDANVVTGNEFGGNATAVEVTGEANVGSDIVD